MMGRGQILRQPGLMVNVPSLVDPTMAPPATATCSAWRCCTRRTACSGGWASSPEPRRWLEQFATLVEPGFLESLGEWRAMTPDRYEREFHLPAGPRHAASPAGRSPRCATRTRS